MLPLVGDIDVMFYYSNHLAIPRGHPPPTQLPAEFHNCVQVFEIVDSDLPGYVYLELRYLLAECVDDSKYIYTEYDRGIYLLNADADNSIVDERRHGPAIITYNRHTHTHNRFTAGLEYVRVHPGQQVPER